MTPRQAREQQLRYEREIAYATRAEELRLADQQRVLAVQNAEVERDMLVQQRLVSQSTLAIQQYESERRLKEERQKLTERLTTLHALPTGVRTRFLENLFEDAWMERYPEVELIPEYRILHFRVDFAHLPSRVIVELDGDHYHRPSRDLPRQHALEDDGWFLTRFSSSQVMNSIDLCIERAFNIIQRRSMT